MYNFFRKRNKRPFIIGQHLPKEIQETLVSNRSKNNVHPVNFKPAEKDSAA